MLTPPPELPELPWWIRLVPPGLLRLRLYRRWVSRRGRARK